MFEFSLGDLNADEDLVRGCCLVQGPSEELMPSRERKPQNHLSCRIPAPPGVLTLVTVLVVIRNDYTNGCCCRQVSSSAVCIPLFNTESERRTVVGGSRSLTPDCDMFVLQRPCKEQC